MVQPLAHRYVFSIIPYVIVHFIVYFIVTSCVIVYFIVHFNVTPDVIVTPCF